MRAGAGAGAGKGVSGNDLHLMGCDPKMRRIDFLFMRDENRRKKKML